MDRLRKRWNNLTEQSYEPLNGDLSEREEHEQNDFTGPSRFSYIEYGIFLLLGVSMLWAWNMMLAAGPYFQARFRDNDWMLENFQAAEISVSTAANLGSMLVLSRMQVNASYPKRIISALGINTVIFSLLAITTAVEMSAGAYFGFLMAMIFGTSLGTGLCQNGIFSFVSGFAQPSYTQGIMTGQAVAGVLPCIVQIVAVLSAQAAEHRQPPPPPPPTDGGDVIPPMEPTVRPAAAMAYFLTATAIAVITLFAFLYLLARQRHQSRITRSLDRDDPADAAIEKKSIPLLHLFSKLRWLVGAVFMTFVVTMMFPVFTQRILSVRPPADQPPILQPPSFIPLAFLFWNIGDLIGRLMTAFPSLSLVRRPRTLFVLSICRLVFVGMYHLCNIRGRGAVVESDFFYLVVVQLLFGVSNGYVGSTCMIGASEWVDPEEREAAGGFMGLCLVCGLAVGSLLSFFVAGA